MCSRLGLIEVEWEEASPGTSNSEWAVSQSWGRMRSEEKKKAGRPRKLGQSPSVTESATGSNSRCTPDLEHVLD